MDGETKQVLKRQRLVYFGLLSVILALGFVVLLFIMKDKGEASRVRAVVDLPGDDIDSGVVLLSRVETQNQTLDTKMRYLESLLLESKKHEASREKENAELKQEVSELNYRVRNLKENQPPLSPQATPIYPANDYGILSDQPELLRPPLQQIVSAKNKEDPSQFRGNDTGRYNCQGCTGILCECQLRYKLYFRPATDQAENIRGWAYAKWC